MQSLISNKPTKVVSTTDTYTKLDDIKLSKPIMTKYEFNQIISQRATMLAHGALPFVTIENNNIDSNMELRLIAIKELLEGKLPFIIKRPLPNNKYDIYRIKDLDLIAVQHMIR